MLDGDAAGVCKGGAFVRSAPLLGFFWPFSCRNKKRANNRQYDRLKFETYSQIKKPPADAGGFLHVLEIESCFQQALQRLVGFLVGKQGSEPLIHSQRFQRKL